MATNNNKPSPSILGDIQAPFSAPPKPAGVSDDFTSIYTQWQNQRNPATNTKLLAAVQPVVDTAVMSYAGSAASPTIKSRAKLMALKALETYDPARGNVRTHLLSQLQSLRRMAAQNQNIIRIPEQVGLDFQHLQESENTLRDQLGRDPTDGELSAHTMLSPKRIRAIRTFRQPVAEGAITTDNNYEDTDNSAVASTIPGVDRGAAAWLNFVYDDLGPTDKLIMDMTLGRNGRRKTSTQDIARKLNITPGAVSQRAAKIQGMLDKRYTQGGF